MLGRPHLVRGGKTPSHTKLTQGQRRGNFFRRQFSDDYENLEGVHFMTQQFHWYKFIHKTHTPRDTKDTCTKTNIALYITMRKT